MDKETRNSIREEVLTLMQKTSDIKKHLDVELIDSEQAVVFECIEDAINSFQYILKTLED